MQNLSFIIKQRLKECSTESHDNISLHLQIKCLFLYIIGEFMCEFSSNPHT